MKKNLSKLITFGFLAIFIAYVIKNPDVFSGLRNVSIIFLILIALGRMLVFTSNGLFIKWTAESFTRKLTTGEGIYVGILSAIGNFFGPLLGGASIRAVYLKKVHNLAYSHFTSTLLGYYLILFIINCVAALTSLTLLPKTSQTKGLVLFFLIWLIVMILSMALKLPRRDKLKKVEEKRLGKKIVSVMYDIEYGWHRIVHDKKLLVRLFFLSILSYLASYFISFIEFRAIGAHIGIAQLGLYTAVVAISLLISITPGAIGIREGLLLFVSTTIGVSNEQILQVAVIDRAVMFSLLFLMFMVTRSKKLKRLFTARDIAV